MTTMSDITKEAVDQVNERRVPRFEAAEQLHGTTDARAWTDKFCSLFDMAFFKRVSDGSPVNDIPGLLFGWFSNAIEAGRAAGTKAALEVNKTVEQWRDDATIGTLTAASRSRMMGLASKVSPDQEAIANELFNLAKAAADVGWRKAAQNGAGASAALEAKEAIEKHAKQLELQIDRMKHADRHVNGRAVRQLRYELLDLTCSSAHEIEYLRGQLAAVEPQAEAYRALLRVLQLTDRGQLVGAGEDPVWRLRQRADELKALLQAEAEEAQRQGGKPEMTGEDIARTEGESPVKTARDAINTIKGGMAEED